MKTIEKLLQESLGDCTCGEIYKSRGGIAPDCIWHNYYEDLYTQIYEHSNEVAGAVKAECVERCLNRVNPAASIKILNVTDFIK